MRNTHKDRIKLNPKQHAVLKHLSEFNGAPVSAFHHATLKALHIRGLIVETDDRGDWVRLTSIGRLMFSDIHEFKKE